MNDRVTCEAVMAAFVETDQLGNQQLFDEVAKQLGIPDEVRHASAPVGRAGKRYKLFERQCRWHQQSLRQAGVLERVDRGVWRLSDEARQSLTPAPSKRVLLAFSTELGCALWGNAEDVFGALGEQVTLAFTSPPYPLMKERAYGNVSQDAYVDWLLPILKPIVKCLRPGGSLVVNVGNDLSGLKG